LNIFCGRKGLSVEELRKNAIEEKARQTLKQREVPSRELRLPTGTPPVHKVRKDSSPVRVRLFRFFLPCTFLHNTQPLSSILNIPLVLSVPHTPAQISALWTAYHASRSSGTGRGYVCATVPVNLYERMARVAGKYPAFVVPVPRLGEGDKEDETACEFYFMQWGFHESPPTPSTSDPLAPPSIHSHTSSNSNPKSSTILFAPLHEYKLRASFATPYFVVTHYTDFARTHGVVLLRGEITPSTGGLGRYFLSQEDAQILAIGVQKFYLWGAGEEAEGEGARLLKVFHENPGEFQWKELLKHAMSA